MSAAWSQVSHCIEAVAHTLQVAFLRNYQAKDLVPLACLPQLVELVMKDRPKLRSLAGLAALPNLQLLGIYLATDLSGFEDLAGPSQIDDLALEACRKIGRIDAIAQCARLRRLSLSDCGDITSVVPIRGLTNLEYLSLFGSTKIMDDDLTPIVELPHLQQLRMKSRRSYRPTAEEVQSLLPRPKDNI